MTLPDATQLYINGAWRAPKGNGRIDLIDPSSEGKIGDVAIASSEDVADAVMAARSAFDVYSKWTVEQRVDLLERINAALIERSAEIGAAVSAEMGAPTSLGCGAQAGSGPQHFGEILKVLKDYPFEERLGSTKLRREPIGVCVLISPWNWPVNQIATKVAPALAAGCTMVLKPSEAAPLDAVILTDILHEAGVPAGVFNLVQGDGPTTGAALCAHPEVDMISFTGSTRAGMAIGEAAGKDVKRVALELGGKSATIFLEGADLEKAVPSAVQGVMFNSGQSCNATAKFLAPRNAYQKICKLAATTAEALTVGPANADKFLGPIANRAQYNRVVSLIDQGVREGAVLLTGGSDRPEGLDAGFFVRPTVFADVAPDMVIAREEIFGPVIVIMPYDDVDEAIRLANDSEYGLSGAVWAADRQSASAVAERLRTGMVHLNGAGLDSAAPFGGYKKSGNGREWGRFGLDEFVELKSMYGAFD